jgi:hypothetical protein
MNRYTKACMPCKGYYSGPFSRRQGSMQNGRIESFNGTLGDELLDGRYSLHFSRQRY